MTVNTKPELLRLPQNMHRQTVNRYPKVWTSHNAQYKQVREKIDDNSHEGKWSMWKDLIMQRQVPSASKGKPGLEK